jgi:pyrimidine deaminase RibD-like protein
MSEQEIFTHLLSIANQSNDTDGVVTSCLVRDGEIIMDAVSAGVEHAEYMLLKKMAAKSIAILPDDVVYVTVQPCDSRTVGGGGESLGDCTTNLISAQVHHIVYGAAYTRSETSNSRFELAGVSVRQTEDINTVRSCVRLFNDTNKNPNKHLPQV